MSSPSGIVAYSGLGVPHDARGGRRDDSAGRPRGEAEKTRDARGMKALLIFQDCLKRWERKWEMKLREVTQRKNIQLGRIYISRR